MSEPDWDRSDIRNAAKYTKCHEDVTRQGVSEPCGKSAVALKRDYRDDRPYPVCKFHARGEGLVSLREIWVAVADA